MSHRMQVVLKDDQYAVLAAEAERTGASIGGLVRQAIDARFASPRVADAVREALSASFGSWQDMPDGARYVDELRTGASWPAVEPPTT